MAKRELIDRTQIEWYGCNYEDGSTCRKNLGDCFVCPNAECDAEKVRALPIITEEEIVRPYLEKLNEHIINFPWSDTSGDFMTGVKAVCNLIDSLLTEKGAEE